MTTASFTSRDFNREPGRIKRAAAGGPVFITERSKPCLVVLAYADYERMTGKRQSLAEALTMPGLSEIELDGALPASPPAAALFD